MIRIATSTDWPAIERIYNQTKLDELQYESQKFILVPLKDDPDRYHKLLESIVTVYEYKVDENQREIVGYLARFEDQIRGLYVARPYRGKGVASKLLVSTLRSSSSNVRLNVAASNAPAQALYRKVGFVVSNEFKAIYNNLETNAFEMTKFGQTKQP